MLYSYLVHIEELCEQVADRQTLRTNGSLGRQLREGSRPPVGHPVGMRRKLILLIDVPSPVWGGTCPTPIGPGDPYAS